MIWNHPVETTIKNWLFWSSREIHFQNPSFLVSIIYSSNFRGRGGTPDLHFSYIQELLQLRTSWCFPKQKFVHSVWIIAEKLAIVVVCVCVQVRIWIEFLTIHPEILYTYIYIYHISICKIKYDLCHPTNIFSEKNSPSFPSLIPGIPGNSDQQGNSPAFGWQLDPVKDGGGGKTRAHRVDGSTTPLRLASSLAFRTPRFWSGGWWWVNFPLETWRKNTKVIPKIIIGKKRLKQFWQPCLFGDISQKDEPAKNTVIVHWSMMKG